MYARCPSCESAYSLKAANLAEAAGVVRCGHCGKTFNALSHLFETHPDTDQPALKGSGVPPMLEGGASTQPELPGVGFEPIDRLEAGPTLDFNLNVPGLGEAKLNRVWLAASMVLLGFLIIQIVLHWQAPESRLASWLANEDSAHRTLATADTVQIITRDMHRHPSLDDAIVISATLRNPGEQTLAWPVLEIRLYDASQQVLGARRLPPSAYLSSGAAVERGMAPELMVPVILEFVVGTTEPSGFELRFF